MFEGKFVLPLVEVAELLFCPVWPSLLPILSYLA